jgi:hypothetical protein
MGRPLRVQNFELHPISKNCFKNKWFIKFHPNRLNIVNFGPAPEGVTAGFPALFQLGAEALSI